MHNLLSDSSTAVRDPLSSDNEAPTSDTGNIAEFTDTDSSTVCLPSNDSKGNSANESNANNSDSIDSDTDVSDELSGSAINTSDGTPNISSRDSSSAGSMHSDASDFENRNESMKNVALMLLNCLKKHNLTSSACSDVLKTVRQVLPADVRNNPLLHYSKVLSFTPSSSYTVVNYCSKYEYIFLKDNGQILRCETQDCGGIVKSFMMADVKEVLKSILKSPGKNIHVIFSLRDLKGHVSICHHFSYDSKNFVVVLFGVGVVVRRQLGSRITLLLLFGSISNLNTMIPYVKYSLGLIWVI